MIAPAVPWEGVALFELLPGPDIQAGVQMGLLLFGIDQLAA